MGFRDDGIELLLYVVTTAKILIYSNTRNCVELESINSELGNSILTPQEKNQDVIVARDEAIYFYGPEGKGPCFIIGGFISFIRP